MMKDIFTANREPKRIDRGGYIWVECGSYYFQNKFKRFYLNIKAYLHATRKFIVCLHHYNDSIIANELTITDCWNLCCSEGDGRIGRYGKIEWKCKVE